MRRQPLEEQAKYADYVTISTCKESTVAEAKEHFLKDVAGYAIGLDSVNVCDLGNVAFLLLKINDPALIADWILRLNATETQ